jgi:hypothetical protein
MPGFWWGAVAACVFWAGIAFISRRSSYCADNARRLWAQAALKNPRAARDKEDPKEGLWVRQLIGH